MSYLGIDIGTTGTKAVVFSEKGQIIASAYREYSLQNPGQGRYELDPRQVISSCKKVIAESAKTAALHDPVLAIGIASQGEAFTLLDKNDQHLCNAMVSFDTRSSEQVEHFCNTFGREKLYRITGHTAHTLFSLFKLLWLKDNHPDLLKQAARFLCMGDLLRYKLTQNAVTSYNLASRTMLFDVSKKRWSPEILNAAGINPEILPQTASSGTSAGTVTSQLARELSLAKDVIVTTGGHDQCCGALGAGVDQSGIAACSLGTVECITPAFSDCVINNTLMEANLATYPHTVDDLYTTVAFCMTGGSGLKWYKDNFGLLEQQTADQSGRNVYDLLIGQIPPKPTGLMLLPHFTSTGTPYFDPSPLGAILGINLSTTKGEILKALLEGISFEMKVNLDLLQSCGIAVNQLRAFGGGIASGDWMQIKADIFNMPISCVQVKEAGCMGAAMLAARGAGKITSLSECCREWVKTDRSYRPNPENAVIYAKHFEIYKDLYADLAPIREKMKNSIHKEIP